MLRLNPNTESAQKHFVKVSGCVRTLMKLQKVLRRRRRNWFHLNCNKAVLSGFLTSFFLFDSRFFFLFFFSVQCCSVYCDTAAKDDRWPDGKCKRTTWDKQPGSRSDALKLDGLQEKTEIKPQLPEWPASFSWRPSFISYIYCYSLMANTSMIHPLHLHEELSD